jgi:hypothetical protein
MSIVRSAAAFITSAVIMSGAIGASTASAADLPVKAVPIASPWVFDVHGYFDVTFASTRVTGGGFLLYPTNSVLAQVEVGLSLDIYKDSTGFINKVSVFGGIWNELYEHAPPAGVRHWQEMDWWAGINVGFAKYWTLSAQSLNFVFPNAAPGAGTAYNYNFALAFDDSFLGLPVVFNPYVSLFYNDKGGSTVVLGKRSDAYRVTFGMNPTINFAKQFGVPLTIWFPTSVVVAPTDFWNRNDGSPQTLSCGLTNNLPCSAGNVGFYTTGLQTKYSLEGPIPKRLGSWYVKAGVQYYHIVNDSLLAAQQFNFATTNFAGAKSDIVLVNGGFGFSY